MLYVIRGLSGSGKTTRAKELLQSKKIHIFFEADMFFINNATNLYTFDASKLSDAHQWCQNKVKESLKSGFNVAVSNTFTQYWELEPYMHMAAELHTTVKLIDLFDSGMDDEQLSRRNIHGVPISSISKMRKRYQHLPEPEFQ